ncbi:MAG: polyprenyl synthetase family protein [Clostridiales bacterium]|nr:polyprenyl synthetase family protein [Clostridiales bacterium]
MIDPNLHFDSVTDTDRLDLDMALHLTSEEIRRNLTGAPYVIRNLTRHLAKAGGKNIRARALLACSAGSDGKTDRRAVLTASAIELLHLATLVHDDIIDNAVLRRGIDTLHKKFGEKNAVLCGDFLFCLAFQLVGRIKPPEERNPLPENLLPAYMTEICLGALREIRNNHNYKLSERAYFGIISGKTAALFEATFYAGFLLSGEPEDNKGGYIDLGKCMGIVFQLSDDCFDYEATKKTMKKPVLSDFSQGVVTLPLIYAIKKDPSLLERIESGISPQDIKQAVRAAGGLAYTHLKIDRYHKKALKIIHSLTVPEEKKVRLINLLDMAAGNMLRTSGSALS